MRRQLLPAIMMMVVFTVVLGIVYPLVVTGISQAAFSDQANGSKLEVNGKVVGSKLLGQTFTKAKYFHGRPSCGRRRRRAARRRPKTAATTQGPEPGHQLGIQPGVRRTRTCSRRCRTASPRTARRTGSRSDAKVPVDAVTASASGLDPHISIANARIQARRVARVRGMSVAEVNTLIDQNTDDRSLGFLGEPGVNVLELNVALDRAK